MNISIGAVILTANLVVNLEMPVKPNASFKIKTNNILHVKQVKKKSIKSYMNLGPSEFK